MGKYRKDGVIYEAFQLSYEMAKGQERVPIWFVEGTKTGKIKVYLTDKIHNTQYCEINTPEGVISTNYDDFIIQETEGEIFTCKAKLFVSEYELIED